MGTAIGPIIGGIVDTYMSWRVIFWIQTGLGALAVILVFFGLPETVHRERSTEARGFGPLQKARILCRWVNPLRVVVMFIYPNFLFVVRYTKSASIPC